MGATEIITHWSGATSQKRLGITGLKEDGIEVLTHKSTSCDQAQRSQVRSTYF